MQSTDPRIAALYDLDNPNGPDHDHYRRLVARLQPDTIVDLGCGTGLLTVTLAGYGRRVVGIDPDAAMLEIARRRVGGEQVSWVYGDSRNIAGTVVDLVLMTGNVVQHIGPNDWHRTLVDIDGSLSDDGVVTFDTRNPVLSEWRQWTKEHTLGTRKTASGKLTEWIEGTEPDEHGTVMLTAHNLWDETGETVVQTQPLTFRGVSQLHSDLERAGLSVHNIWGGWSHQSVSADSPLLVVEARAP